MANRDDFIKSILLRYNDTLDLRTIIKARTDITGEDFTEMLEDVIQEINKKY